MSSLNKNFVNTIEDDGADSFKTTYMDLVTLLLCFFILLSAISTMDLAKFQKAKGSINYTFKSKQNSDYYSEVVIHDVDMDDFQYQEQALGFENEHLITQVQTYLKNNKKLKKLIKATYKNGKITIRANNQIMFVPGDAKLEDNSKELLDQIYLLTKSFPEFVVHIQGHTDNTPISDRYFASNWELSAIRATNVLRYLLKKGVRPDRMTATGYADTFPIGTNKTLQGRSKNRRVDFVLEKEKNEGF